jgi:hypothetical protein
MDDAGCCYLCDRCGAGGGMTDWPDVEHRLKSAVKLCEIKNTKAIIRLLLEVLMELWKGL